MKKAFCLVVTCLCLAACESPNSPEKEEVKLTANVVMTEGPVFEDGYTIFYYKGSVKNIGTGPASYVKIYVFLRRTDGSLITQEYSYSDDYNLEPGESSPWDVLISDGDKAKRGAMDKSKTTFEIKWD